MTFETIIFERDSGAYRIVLNRPDRLNAFTAQMHGEVSEALGQVERDREARVLLLTGAGRGFCAGQDLAERNVKEGPLDLGEGPDRFYNPLVRRLTELPLPVVCAVNGVAAGAGVNLAIACDLVVARKSAKFAQAFAKIGLVPDAGGSWHLPRLIGHARATGFTMTGATIDAETAERWGMIWQAIDDDRFDTEVDALVGRLARAPTVGLAASKKALRASWTSDLSSQLDLERDLQRSCGHSDDYREGVSAFKERRPPAFTGR